MATVFAAGIILYSSLWMYAVRRPVAPVELGFRSDYSENDHSLAILNVLRGSPAEKAGLQAADHILAVNGRSLESIQPIAELWFHSKPGDSVELAVERAGQPGPLILHATFRAAQPQSSAEGLARESASQVTRSYPVLFLVVGLAVFFLRVDDRNAWLLALLFAGFIAVPGPPTLFGTSPSFAALSPGLEVFAKAYRATFLGLFGALFYLFFALFPTRSSLERRLPWLKWVAFVLGACAALPSLRVGDVRAPAALAGLLGEHLASRVMLASSIYLFFGLGIVSLFGNARSIDSGVRRKTRVVLWGTIAGVLPAAAERAAVDFAGFRPPFWMDTTVILAVLLFPLSFAYAVVRHRVMEIPVLLKRSARYVLVQRGYFVLLFLAAATAIALFTHTISRFFPAGTNFGMALSAVFGIVLVWASAPMVKRGTERIDRAFFRSAYDARMILQDLAEKTRTVTNRSELARLLELHIEGALHPKSLVCYLAAGDGNLVAECGRAPRELDTIPAALPRPKFPFRFGARFVPRELDTIPATLPLLSELARRGRAWDVPPPGPDEAGELAPLAPECLVPILGRNSGLIGLLILGPRLSEEPYSGEDKQLLDSVASQAGVTLENIALAEKMAERMEAERRVAVEMDIARRVQARLFPQNLPPMKTLEYVGGCLQAREVGGDYYDFLDMGPGVLGIVLADISGKGMSGALLMANLQANLRSQYAVARDDLPRLLQSVNRLFCQNTTEESYTTMFFGLYDDSSRKLRYANCGHIAPLLLRVGGSIQRLTSTTTVLGLFLDWESPIEEVQLHPGDLLVICTDGVTEALNRQGDEYGEARFAEIIRENRDLPVNDLLAAIQAGVQEFSGGSQADDITLIVVRCR
ncbi:MAG TPA: SpoIIE family protein phosphatase [Candidatus Acidoferrales bacterium]|nr:SpoIIE family protein phosphatase [Candidatus Acidoferrales bacterium]